jgi:hypothetical protein
MAGCFCSCIKMCMAPLRQPPSRGSICPIRSSSVPTLASRVEALALDGQTQTDRRSSYPEPIPSTSAAHFFRPRHDISGAAKARALHLI